MSELTDSVHTYLATAAASGFAGLQVTMLNHWQGHENLLWRVRCEETEAVAKLFMDAGQVRGRRQLDGHQLFAQRGLAPTPLWFDRYPEGLARQLLVYNWVSGEPPDVSDPGQLAELARAAAQVHASDPEELRRFSPRPFNLDYYWRMIAGGVTTIEQWLPASDCPAMAGLFTRMADRAGVLVGNALPLWQGAPPAPVHGDLKLENAVMALGTALLVDWELFGLGDAALEVAAFLFASQSEIDEESQETWLDAYLSHVDDAAMNQRISVYRQLLPLEHLSFLLNGARNLSAAERNSDEFRASAPFLAETLLATLTQSSIALDIPVMAGDPVLQQETRALFNL
ncbi:MAG: aminoglycoside phosphotransferase family protein [Caldilineaceae bacterium]|nr:aminoglycoside phosphotransferase family protein [Caldilineaceae bacterium]